MSAAKNPPSVAIVLNPYTMTLNSPAGNPIYSCSIATATPVIEIAPLNSLIIA
jgi:hypothetical protein